MGGGGECGGGGGGGGSGSGCGGGGCEERWDDDWPCCAVSPGCVFEVRCRRGWLLNFSGRANPRTGDPVRLFCVSRATILTYLLDETLREMG